jgi:hypothetical protein
MNRRFLKAVVVDIVPAAAHSAPAGDPFGLRSVADAGSKGFLKKYVSGRTINVHAHLYAAEWWSLPPAERDPGAMLGSVPYFRDSRAAEAKAVAALDGPAGDRIMYGSDYPIFVGMYSEKD